MIKFGHDGLQIFHRRTYLKMYDGEDVLRWNFEVEPFVA
jgi:hypothetical protein